MSANVFIDLLKVVDNIVYIYIYLFDHKVYFFLTCYHRFVHF